MADSAVRSFSINIGEDELNDLGRRLAATRWPEAETADGWNQGLPQTMPESFALTGGSNTGGATGSITSTHFRNFRLSYRGWIFTSFM